MGRLTQGYSGYGMDARARKSWALYAEQGTKLTASLLDAPAILRGDARLPTGAFLIGNHADELTPWIPLLATSTRDCAGFLNIPCCAWTLEGARFTPTQARLDNDELAQLVLGCPWQGEARMPTSPHRTPSDVASLLSVTLWFAQRLTKSPDENAHSKHLAYYAYVTHLHMQAGWCLESEALRIPSTKNWALVGRRRVDATGIPGAESRAQQWSALASYAATLTGTMVAHAGAHD